MKFELTDNTIEHDGVTLHQIRCTETFNNGNSVFPIYEGTLGGYVQRKENLCDNAWIFKPAKVYGNARVSGNATVSGTACVFGNAVIKHYARVSFHSSVYGNAVVAGNARIYDYSQIYDYARVYGQAHISDYSQIYENAKVFGNVRMLSNAIVRDHAQVGGDTVLQRNAVLSEEHLMHTGVCACDLSTNLEESIRCQCNLLPVNGKVIAYKMVADDLSSFYNSKFKYVVGETAVVKRCSTSKAGCGSGLHFSNPNYWNSEVGIRGRAFLIAEIDLKDIRAVQRGKIRCKKAKILGSYKPNFVNNKGEK